jgi:hypothetical protein
MEGKLVELGTAAEELRRPIDMVQAPKTVLKINELDLSKWRQLDPETKHWQHTVVFKDTACSSKGG